MGCWPLSPPSPLTMMVCYGCFTLVKALESTREVASRPDERPARIEISSTKISARTSVFDLPLHEAINGHLVLWSRSPGRIMSRLWINKVKRTVNFFHIFS